MAELEKPRPNSFKLYRNKYKQKDSHPDWLGRRCDADRVEYELAAGESPTRSGGTFIAGKVTLLEDAMKLRKAAKDKPKKESDVDDLQF